MVTQQLGLEGMPRRLFSCTPSKLASFEDCPRRYRYAYRDRPAPPKGAPWAHNSLGAAVHNALRAWWDLPLRRRTQDAAAPLVKAAWIGDGFRDAAQQKAVRDRATGWVAAYLAVLDPLREPIGVERVVATRTDRLALSGRVDRLDDRDGELVVVDYKTGRSRLSLDDARGSRALALYALAVSRTMRRPCRRVELHHLPTGTVHSVVHDEGTLARHLARATAIADDIEQATGGAGGGVPGGPGSTSDEQYPVRTGPHCSWCDFRRHCPPGRAAAPDKEPWAGLAGSDTDG
jgi:RecB family exonuclease